MSSKTSGILVLFGTILVAFTNWYLIFLFARAGEGAASVGEYSSILAFATPVFVCSQLGLRTILVSHKSRFSWRAYFLLRLLGSFAGACVILAWLYFTASGTWELGISVVALKVANSIDDIFQARIQFAGRMGILGSIMIINGLATVVVSTLGVFIGGRIEFGVLGSAMVSSLSAIVSARASKAVFNTTRPPKRFEIFEIIRSAIPITASQFFASLLFQIPVLILMATDDVTTVGLYTSAAYLMTVASLIGSTLQTILITPFRTTLEKSGTNAVLQMTHRYTSRILMISIPCAVGVVWFGDLVLKVFYGQEFGIGYSPLVLLSVACIFTIIAYIYSVVLNIFNQYSFVTFSMCISCAVSFAVGAYLLNSKFDLLTLGFLASAVGALTRALSMYLFTRHSASIESRSNQNREQ